ncbi:MAG: protein arginine kinase [Phycisphaeraceae bacterium]
MSVPDLGKTASQWLRGDGPRNDVVVSSRVRLARNIAGYPFLSRASATQRNELLHTCQQRILDAELSREMLWVPLAESTPLDRLVLSERHMISRQHGQGDLPRGVALSPDESFAIMVNEEDHIRLSCLRAGLQLEDAYEHANRLDDTLESRMDFAYSSRLGYLTACPTNLGTGIRVSVMLHLPGLKLTGEIDKLRRAAKDMHLAVRGFYGEGTEAVGDLFQISNQTTLGRSEQQILDDFSDVVIPEMIEYEQRAREALAEDRPAVLDDKIFRALGTLSHARLLGSEEALYLLSYLRLGVSLNRTASVSLSTVNELFLLSQPAHLQKIAGQELTGPERREYRATFVRKRLGM